jgi:hypothetical protein
MSGYWALRPSAMLALEEMPSVRVARKETLPLKFYSIVMDARKDRTKFRSSVTVA